MRPLSDLSDRTLALLGSLAALGRAVTIVRGHCHRAEALVGFRDLMVLVGPQHTLGDVLLCCALLRFERQARELTRAAVREARRRAADAPAEDIWSEPSRDAAWAELAASDEDRESPSWEAELDAVSEPGHDPALDDQVGHAGDWTRGEEAEVLRRAEEAARRAPIDPAVVRTWARTTRERFMATLPGLFRFGGRLLFGAALPAVHDVLPCCEPSLAGAAGAATEEISIRLTGEAITSSDDLAARLRELLTLLESGRLPEERLEVLPELPVVVVPGRIVTPAVRGARHARLFELLAEVEGSARGMADCMREKLEGPLPDALLRERTRSGRRLDLTRLHEVALAARTGGSPRIFAERHQVDVQRFEPREHLNVVLIDAGAVSATGRSRMAVRFVYAITRAAQLMEADALILAFSDLLVPLPGGRDVLLHEPYVIQRPGEPFDDTTFMRLELVLDAASPLPPCAFLPLAYRGLADAVRTATSSSRYTTYSLIGLTPAGLGRDRYESADKVRRMTEDMDVILRRTETETGGRWSASCFGPRRWIAHAPRGGLVATWGAMPLADG